MKLKCKHKRRVVVVGELNRVLHRSDGSRCKDHTLRLGNSVVETRDPSGLLFVYDGVSTRFIRTNER
jgi:hypothetical protein